MSEFCVSVSYRAVLIIPVCGSCCWAHRGQGSECFYLEWSVRLGHIVKGELLNLENTLERLGVFSPHNPPGVEKKMEGKVIFFGVHIYLARAHLAARSDCMTLTSPSYLAGGSRKSPFHSFPISCLLLTSSRPKLAHNALQLSLSQAPVPYRYPPTPCG